MTLPPLDAVTRDRASRNAVAARRLRAEWKQRLARGEVDLAALLAAAESDEALAGMRITEALGALPGVGPRGVERILSACGIAPSRRLRGLGHHQRDGLVRGAWGRERRA